MHLCYSMYAMLRYAMLCYAMLCYAVPCYAWRCISALSVQSLFFGETRAREVHLRRREVHLRHLSAFIHISLSTAVATGTMTTRHSDFTAPRIPTPHRAAAPLTLSGNSLL